MLQPDITRVKQFLQDVDLNVFVDRTNAQDDLDATEVVVPSEIPLNMLVVVRPGTGALVNEAFWLARVIEVLDSGRYKLRYFKHDSSKKKWAPGIGKAWYGTCSHDAILLAGVNMNEDGSITAASLRHINFVVKND